MILAVVGTILTWTPDLSTGDAIVGGATILLAIATVWLAWSTRRSVAEAKRAIAAEDMPFVLATEVPQHANLAQTLESTNVTGFPRCGLLSNGWLTMRFENFGRGPAIVEDVRLELDGQDCLKHVFSRRPISAGGQLDEVWRGFQKPSGGKEAEHRGTLDTYYRHADGRLLRTSSRVRLAKDQLMLDTFQRDEPKHLPTR